MKKSAIPSWAGQALLPLSMGSRSEIEPGQQTVLTAQIDVPFLAKGLVIWGATRDTYLVDIKSGNTQEFIAGGYPAMLPARYFDAPSGATFESLLALAEAGDLEHAFEARQILSGAYEMHPGNYMRVVLQGPFENLVAWGLRQTHDIPPVKARIYREGDLYKGVLTRRTLSGDHDSIEVEATASADAASLLSSLQPRHW